MRKGTVFTLLLFAALLSHGRLNTPFPTFGRVFYVDKDNHPVKKEYAVSTIRWQWYERTVDYNHRRLLVLKPYECTDEKMKSFTRKFVKPNCSSALLTNPRVEGWANEMRYMKKFLSYVIYKEFVEYGLDVTPVLECQKVINDCCRNSSYWLGWANYNNGRSMGRRNNIIWHFENLLDGLDIIHNTEYVEWCKANSAEYRRLRSKFVAAVNETAKVQAEIDKVKLLKEMTAEVRAARQAAEEAKSEASSAWAEAEDARREAHAARRHAEEVQLGISPF